MASDLDWPNVQQEKEKCTDFLQNYSQLGYQKYQEQLQEIADRQRNVLEISMDDIIQHNHNDDLANNIRRNTMRYIKIFEDVADEIMPVPTVANFDQDIFDILQSQRQRTQTDPAAPTTTSSTVELPKALSRRYEVCIMPTQTDKPRKLREVRASDIGSLVVIKGLVTRASDVKPHISVCTYTCDVCGSEIYQEVIGSQFMPLINCSSQRCKETKTGGRIDMQTRGSRFVKYQEIRVQELPDQVPVGHIPRSIIVHCKGEQTRRCGPGDIVTISGVFLTVRFSGFKAIRAGLQADSYIEALSIEKQKLNYSDMEVDDSAYELVRDISETTDAYGKLANSIAPEIFGHEDVKKALLLQLVGGVTRELPDGMKIRGDINILLMGDPGVAKSQLLKYVASVAPRGVYTTGKGSSGVGLTAAVVRDTVTGEMALEGGALVLADMGICCIDEFDKMDESDRTAIHEVMEQQTISIAKAGITTRLNARAAVLAAANPLYGRYNRKKSITENVDLPNSLLSRFDLLFLILDKADMESDLALSKHVLFVHKYLRTPDKESAPFQPSVIKKYISIARSVRPSIPQELTSYITEAYVSLRSKEQSKQNHDSKVNDQTVMTPRQLLSILRLSQALARMRISELVSREDVDEAIRLTHQSKSSLLDDDRGHVVEDATTAIYSMIRDYLALHATDTVNYGHIEVMVLKKGFTAQQLQTCLDEYEGLGVFSLNADRSRITILSAM